MKQIKALQFVFVAFLIANCSWAEELKLFFWEEYIAPEVVEAFERETGHTIEQFYLDNDEERDAIIISGRGGRFDLVIIDSQSLKTDGDVEYFHTISDLKAPNVKHLTPQSRKACGQRGVPYAWGTVGLAYRESVNQNGITSWMQLFNITPENRGKTMIITDSIDITMITLLALGLPPLSSDKDHLRQAYALLKQQKPSLYSYGYGLSRAIDLKQNFDLTLMMIYSSDVETLQRITQQQDWRFVLPKEGFVVWTDCLAIPKSDKPVKQATYDFLNFINRPEIAKLNAESILFSSPNQSALKLASPEYLNNPILFPNPEVIKKGIGYSYLPNEQLRLRSRMLQKLMMGQ